MRVVKKFLIDPTILIVTNSVSVFSKSGSGGRGKTCSSSSTAQQAAKPTAARKLDPKKLFSLVEPENDFILSRIAENMARKILTEIVTISHVTDCPNEAIRAPGNLERTPLVLPMCAHPILDLAPIHTNQSVHVYRLAPVGYRTKRVAKYGAER